MVHATFDELDQVRNNSLACFAWGVKTVGGHCAIGVHRGTVWMVVSDQPLTREILMASESVTIQAQDWLDSTGDEILPTELEWHILETAGFDQADVNWLAPYRGL